MAVVDDSRVRQAVLASKIQSFSSDLVALQSCRDDDELYGLLIRAIEGEPFLMSRIVRTANSVVFAGRNTGFACDASECLLRIGLMMAKQIVEDFLIDQALGRIVRANRFSRSVWREARLAGSVASSIRGVCEEPFDIAGPGLPGVMSFLGELFVTSIVQSENEMPVLQIPKGDEPRAVDVVEVTLLALGQMQMPEPVELALRAIPAVGRDRNTPFIKSAAAVLYSRHLVRSMMHSQTFSARVDKDTAEAALDLLRLDEETRADLKDYAKRMFLGS